MKAIRVHACGGPEALRYDDVAAPEPQAGEALVEIAAAGVNFIDVQHRTGRYKPPALPFTLGSEAAGTVTAVGAGVTRSRRRRSRRVCDGARRVRRVRRRAGEAARQGARTRSICKTAAAVMLQGLTAHYLTHSTYRAQAGRHGARARGGRRSGAADHAGRAAARRDGVRHRRRRSEGRARARGGRRRDDRLPHAGLRGRDQEAHERPRRRRRLRLRRQGHVRQEPELPAAARHARAVRFLERARCRRSIRPCSARRARCS